MDPKNDSIEYGSDDDDDEDIPALVDRRSSADDDDEINSKLNEIAISNLGKWGSIEMKLTKQTWFGDSAASSHMRNDDNHQCQICTRAMVQPLLA